MSLADDLIVDNPRRYARAGRCACGKPQTYAAFLDAPCACGQWYAAAPSPAPAHPEAAMLWARCRGPLSRRPDAPARRRAAYIWRRRTGGTVVESALFATVCDAAACDDFLVAPPLTNAYAFAATRATTSTTIPGGDDA